MLDVSVLPDRPLGEYLEFYHVLVVAVIMASKLKATLKLGI